MSLDTISNFNYKFDPSGNDPRDTMGSVDLAKSYGISPQSMSQAERDVLTDATLARARTLLGTLGTITSIAPGNITRRYSWRCVDSSRFYTLEERAVRLNDAGKLCWDSPVTLGIGENEHDPNVNTINIIPIHYGRSQAEQALDAIYTAIGNELNKADIPIHTHP
jgi:hypothetical protein